MTYRQQRPNPYRAPRREDLYLHCFGLRDFRAEDSGALRRTAGPASADRVEALAHLAGPSIGQDDHDALEAALDELDALVLPADRDSPTAREQAAEVRRALTGRRAPRSG